MYRSKVWRTRLDTTTNWAVATTGIALSVTFISPENSPLPLILIGLLIEDDSLFKFEKEKREPARKM